MLPLSAKRPGKICRLEAAAKPFVNHAVFRYQETVWVCDIGTNGAAIMAKDDDEAEVAGAEDGEEGEGAKKKFGLKKILLFVVLPLIVLGGGGGGAAWWFGLFGGGDEEAAIVEPPPKPAVFYDLPEMTVNLVSATTRDQYLRLKVSLELSDQDTIAKIEPNLPRVLDAFQVYLRELRTTDFEGSAGIFRLKEELQRRINVAVYPAKVDGILFREIIVQ